MFINCNTLGIHTFLHYTVEIMHCCFESMSGYLVDIYMSSHQLDHIKRYGICANFTTFNDD